ncbi:MAG: beta-N-acetylhexosaminidase [Pseudomonadota bacterium]
MTFKSFIAGSSGLRLTKNEIHFFRQERPCGFILFQRNCETSDQVKSLIQDVKDAVQADTFLVLIDQEGGRVARLMSPTWPAFPAASCFGAYYNNHPDTGIEATQLASRWLAAMLYDLGITVNCVPVLDTPAPDAHDIIGNRAYDTASETIIALGQAVMAGHLDGGVLPVIKHIPGHGRADTDSHLSLPTIMSSLDELKSTDFVPFRALNHAPLGMTGHLLIPALDPQNSVSTSSYIISDIIRGDIGFDGLLMSDDLSMGALKGSMTERTSAVLSAGCDIALHCNGDLQEMREVAHASPLLSDAALQRFHKALALLQTPEPFDKERAKMVIDEILTLGP